MQKLILIYYFTLNINFVKNLLEIVAGGVPLVLDLAAAPLEVGAVHLENWLAHHNLFGLSEIGGDEALGLNI